MSVSTGLMYGYGRINMKKSSNDLVGHIIVVVTVCILSYTSLTACSKVFNNVSDTITNELNDDSNEKSSKDDLTNQNISDKNYVAISFTDLPESINDDVNLDSVANDVSLIGYLSDSISSDKSTAYIFNNSYGTVPSELNFGKVAVLDLSKTVLNDNLSGDNYVEVKGTIINEDFVDIYNTKSSWHICVDSVEPLIELPNNVQEYQDYMESDEFEAFAKMIDFIGNAIYSWYEDETVVELELEDVGCDTKKLSKSTEEKYPGLYNVIKDYEDTLSEYYLDIVDLIENKERPDDIEKYYSGLYENYAGLSDDIIKYSMVNNE